MNTIDFSTEIFLRQINIIENTFVTQIKTYSSCSIYLRFSDIFRYFNVELIKSITIDAGICVPTPDSIWCNNICNWCIKILNNKLGWWTATDNSDHCFKPSITRMRISNCFYFYLLIISELCATMDIR